MASRSVQRSGRLRGKSSQPRLSPKGAVQINDVYWDDRGLVFAADRFCGGLYVLEMTA